LEGVLAGLATVSVAGSGTVTVDAALDESPVAAARQTVLLLTGTLTAGVNLVLPTWAGKWWFIQNNSTGAFTVTVKTAAGTGFVIAQGYGALVFCDGTNIQRLSGDISAAALIRATLGPNGTQQHAVPAVASDTFALLAAVQTLTGKTLTSPAIGTSVLDTNGNVLLALAIVVSAVNRIQLANGATGNAPSLQAAGSDTNIDFLLSAKGSGVLRAGSAVLGNGAALSLGYVSIAMSDATITPTGAQVSNRVLELTGTLSATRSVNLPNVAGAEFVVANLTTGGYSLTFLVSGQTGVTVANGKRATIYCNGADYVRVTPDT
jgi:hypothetical protein